jgi:hypothetical protein
VFCYTSAILLVPCPYPKPNLSPSRSFAISTTNPAFVTRPGRLRFLPQALGYSPCTPRPSYPRPGAGPSRSRPPPHTEYLSLGSQPGRVAASEWPRADQARPHDRYPRPLHEASPPKPLPTITRYPVKHGYRMPLSAAFAAPPAETVYRYPTPSLPPLLTSPQ